MTARAGGPGARGPADRADGAGRADGTDRDRADGAGRAPEPAGGRGRGPWLVGAAVVVVTAVGVVGALGLGGDGTESDDTEGRSGGTVRVTRGTLTDETEIDGELGHGPEVPFPVRAEGTVTWLPERGDTVRRGHPLLRVDDRPVVLLYGSLPMYRGLGVAPESGDRDGPAGREGDAGDGDPDGEPGREDPGRDDRATGGSGTDGAARDTGPPRGMDVQQFESNLAALGYGGFTVDDTYSALTADAVKRWQKDTGLPQTGSVGIGDVVYAPGPIRIAGSTVRVGAPVGGEPLSYTSTSRMVTVRAPAGDTAWAERGTRVTVELPDGRSVRGEVSGVGTDAVAPEGGDPGGADGGAADADATVQVVVTFDDQEALGRLHSGPATVRYVGRERKDVLTVPVAALVALAEGGHGLELADGTGGEGAGKAGGSGRFVPVRTGLFADGKVEVSGTAVREGMKVRIPE
ncbi:peptidoglycan-binding protein [Streptomyces sp. NPDC018031]|uniref:peptidoglycan-binding protein n=1 Tax=Streptomyces sp. NPDC018031 TaxID=3365033 RepID=UPI00378FB00F